MIKINLIPHLSVLLTFTLTLSTSINLPKVNAQPASFNIDNFLKCGEYCRQLPTDNKYRNLNITQKLIDKLPKWNNICEELTGESFCSLAKSYQFKNGLIFLKVTGTEGFFTDIKFDSGISSKEATKIAKQSFNNGESFAKMERLKNRIALYSNPLGYGADVFYLQKTYLILNSKHQVVRIISVSTSP